jgi:hypothetical protein
MTANDFRSLALGLPEAEERAHMGHPDFRVRGKIFATLWPGDEWGMVKLTPLEQASFIEAKPSVFEPVNGAWGARGCTKVRLRSATKGIVWRALIDAWRNAAPKRLAQEFDDD